MYRVSLHLFPIIKLFRPIPFFLGGFSSTETNVLRQRPECSVMCYKILQNTKRYKDTIRSTCPVFFLNFDLYRREHKTIFISKYGDVTFNNDRQNFFETSTWFSRESTIANLFRTGNSLDIGQVSPSFDSPNRMPNWKSKWKFKIFSSYDRIRFLMFRPEVISGGRSWGNPEKKFSSFFGNRTRGRLSRPSSCGRLSAKPRPLSLNPMMKWFGIRHGWKTRS